MKFKNENCESAYSHTVKNEKETVEILKYGLKFFISVHINCELKFFSMWKKVKYIPDP